MNDTLRQRAGRLPAAASALALALAGLAALAPVASRAADPLLTSWLTNYSGQYARVYTNDTARTNHLSATTWSNGSETQALPAYSGISEIDYSANWVYVRSSGLATHIMGPWYNDAAHTVTFPNLPVNQYATWRFPRTPTAATTTNLTGLGVIGYFADGVAMYDCRDAFYWNGSTDTQGTGSWNRDAWVNEGMTFDPGFAHQQNTGSHHYHANPVALRYQLGDNVLYDAAAQSYSENTNNPSPKHSPILGWAGDGYPVYGPYGYANATNANSGVRRILTGFVRRNGQAGTTNLTTAGRNTIPLWAARFYGSSVNQTGPAVSSTYPLGRYIEDNDFLGDLTNSATGQPYQMGVDYDLDTNNGRFCMTPEYPNGTYAYFVTIDATGTPVFPYNVGRALHGNVTGGSVTTITETVTTNFVGAANLPLRLGAPRVANAEVTLAWSAVEGGTYLVLSATNLSNWTTNATAVAAVGNTGTYTGPAAGGAAFFRVALASLASYDTGSTGTGGGTGGGGGITSVSPTSAHRGSTITLTINFSANATPPPPPQNAPINSVTVGALTGTGSVHLSQTQVTTTLTIPSGAAQGPQTVTVVFPGPPTNPTQTVSFTLANGFTIN